MRRPRLLYLDNLRTLLIILVILTHLAITYGAEGSWYYNEEGSTTLAGAVLMTLMNAINQSFFMGFFLMISAYFVPGSYDRKGPARFMVDRLKRLGIPFLFQILLIDPIIIYILDRRGGFQGGIGEFLNHYVHREGLGTGPLWFLEVLLIFSAAYVVWRLLTRGPAADPSDSSRSEGARVPTAPGNLAILLVALAIAGVNFLVRVRWPVGTFWGPLHFQLAQYAQYPTYFVIGILAYRGGWLAGLKRAQGRLWMWVAIVLAPVFVAIGVLGGALEGNLDAMLGGPTWQSLAYCVWEQLMGAAMTVTLLVCFRDRLNHQGRLAAAMSASAYGVFVVHMPVIVLLALALSGIRFDMGLKFLVVAPIAVALCFLVATGLRKLPGARAIL